MSSLCWSMTWAGGIWDPFSKTAGGIAQVFHLDTFAAEDIQLRRHYSPAPVCAPSRASLLLGIDQGHANVRDNQFDKALENNHTLGTVLKQAGYSTAVIGRWGLGGNGLPAPARPEARGFDYIFGYLEHGDAHLHYPKENGANVYDGTIDISANLDKCYSTDLITARAKKWIVDQRAASPSHPLFVYLAFTAHDRFMGCGQQPGHRHTVRYQPQPYQRLQVAHRIQFLRDQFQYGDI